MSYVPDRDDAARTGGAIHRESNRAAHRSKPASREALEMQGVRSSRRGRLRGSEPVCRDQQSVPPCAPGAAPAVGVMALAPAFGQALPLLNGIPAEYNHQAHAELLLDLCAALVRAG